MKVLHDVLTEKDKKIKLLQTELDENQRTTHEIETRTTKFDGILSKQKWVPNNDGLGFEGAFRSGIGSVAILPMSVTMTFVKSSVNEISTPEGK